MRVIQRAVAEHNSKTGDNPTMLNLAKATKLPAARIREMLDNCAAANCLSIDALSRIDESSMDQVLTSYNQAASSHQS